MLFSHELQKRLEGSGVCVYSVHPGAVATELNRDIPEWAGSAWRFVQKIFFKTSEEGAWTQVLLASEPSLANQCGKYWSDCKVEEESALVRNPILALNLWRNTEDAIHSKL